MNEQDASGIDFSAYFLNDTSAVAINLPSGLPMLCQGQPVVVHVFGPSTTQHTAARDALDREASLRLVASFGGKPQREQDKDADAQFLTAVTQRIDNFPFPGGVAAVYREPRLKYLADQVRAHLGDLGNFFGPSGKA